MTQPLADADAVTPEAVRALVVRLTGPGQIFEVGECTEGGPAMRVFTNAASSMVDLLAQGRGHGSQVFLVHEHQRLTFDDFFSRVDALAAAFQHGLGILAGDRVAIAMRNSPDWMVAFAAAVHVGAVVVPINSWGSLDELEYSLRNSQAKVLVADPARATLLAPVLATLPAVVLTSDDGDPDTEADLAGVRRLGATIDSYRGVAYTVATPAPDDTALVLYTSGSTGHPKGVMHRHRGVCQAVMHMFFAGYLPVELVGSTELRGGATTESQLLTVPLFHATGLCSGFLIPLVAGHKVAILRKWDAVRALEVIEAEQITMLASVPTILKDLLSSVEFDSYDTTSLSRVAAAGAATPVDLPDLISARIGATVRSSGFGMTESMGVAATMSGPIFDLRPTAAGIVSPIIAIRFVDPLGNLLPEGEQGEIQLRGVTLTQGYLGLDDATVEAFTPDGWYRTGDIGWIDGDGFLHVTGRRVEMVIRGGENIYPAEIENAAYRHPAVKEAAAFGVEHPDLGEELGLVCYPHPGLTLTVQQLHEHLAALLPKHKIPRHVSIAAGPLPRNASEKIHRSAVRARFLPS